MGSETETRISTDPGGSSSTGPTSSSATLLQLELIKACPLLRERRALRAVQGDLQPAEPEQRALEPDRRQRDADLLEQLVFRQPRELLRLAPLRHVDQHRSRRLADRAAAAGELDVLARRAVVGARDVDRDLV